MKSYVKDLAQLAHAVLIDVAQTFPPLAAEILNKDLQRLRLSGRNRGLAFYTKDLPALGKALDRSLDTGTYASGGVHLSGRISGRVQVPKFLRGLYLRVFDPMGRLQENPDVLAIRFLRQIFYLGKKVVVECSEGDVNREVANFIAVDDGLPEPDQFWSRPHPTLRQVQDCTVEAVDVGRCRYRDALPGFYDTLRQCVGIVTRGFWAYSPDPARCKHGPGAVAEGPRSINKYHFRYWNESLDNYFPISEFGCHNWNWAREVTERLLMSHRGSHLDAERSSELRPTDNSVAPDKLGSILDQHARCVSRLIAVPKDRDKPRLIAAEPLANQYCQQEIKTFLYDIVEKGPLRDLVGFRDQTRNQKACLEGSLTGELVTLDLKAASDHLLPEHVARLFESSLTLLGAAHAVRSQGVQYADPKYGLRIHTLRKYACMGSALTFPLQALWYLCLALASVAYIRRQKPTPAWLTSQCGKVSVFGDDIIVPKDVGPTLVEVLTLEGFKVNTQKSFMGPGGFRESCGVDAFRGSDVTPISTHGPCLKSAESVASRVAAANNAVMAWMPTLSRALAATVPKGIPWIEAGSTAFGLRTFGAPPRLLRSRWNKNLQIVEVRCLSPVSETRRTPTGDETPLLQYFLERPSPETTWSSGVTEFHPTKLRWVWVDHSLLYPNQVKAHDCGLWARGAK